MNIVVTITGLDEFKAAAAKLPLVAEAELAKVAEKTVMLTLWQNSIAEAPTGKGEGGGKRGYGGNLKQSIRAKMLNKLSGVVQALSPYAIYVLEGTKPHWIEGNNYLWWKGARHPVTHVFHPGTKPNPFFDRAIKKTIPKIQEYMAEALQNIINTLK